MNQLWAKRSSKDQGFIIRFATGGMGQVIRVSDFGAAKVWLLCGSGTIHFWGGMRITALQEFIDIPERICIIIMTPLFENVSDPFPGVP